MKQIDKNTVKADNQLPKEQYVTFINPDGKGKRVMFVGNSITKHGVRPEIGWYDDWGMAASALENDYVHIVAKEILQIDSDASFCLCQVAEWERNYCNGDKFLSSFEDARNFKADIIIMRMVENCPQDNYNSGLFEKEYENLISYLNSTGNAKIILSTGFWAHIADGTIREYAKNNKYPLVELNDLGEDDSMKTIGLFEHSGVANHPGDKGMKEIADRILKVVKEFI